jgi:hypothetical protein
MLTTGLWSIGKEPRPISIRPCHRGREIGSPSMSFLKGHWFRKVRGGWVCRGHSFVISLDIGLRRRSFQGDRGFENSAAATPDTG